MQAEENEKLQKNIDNERAKKERQAKKRKLDEEAARKKELLQIKRNNKARENCHECSKERKNDKKFKSTWLFCFACGKWCCSECQPDIFSTACSQVYRCTACLSHEVQGFEV